MPYPYSQNKIAVKYTELVPRFWNQLSSLQQELHRYKEKPFGIKKLQSGGHGRELLIDFDSLNPQIQEALGDPRKADHPLEPYFEYDAEAVRFYNRFKRDNGTFLTKEEQEKYIINASVLQAVIRLEQSRIQERIRMKGSLSGITETLRYDTESFQHCLKYKHQVEHTLPTSRRFTEVLRDFKKDSYYVIIKDPKGSGRQNARKVDSTVEMLFNALFQNQAHKPTPTEVARNYAAFLTGYAEVYNEDTGELFNPKDFKKLSQATIINYINKWENRIATHHARSGNRQQFMGQYKPHHQMDLPVFAGSLLSIDDRQPPFWYDKGKRAWFYIGLDVASHCITSVVYGKSKEGIIVDFYRQIVRNYTEWNIGLPLELECESSLNSSYRNTLLRPGAMFDNVRIEANNARGKYIERAFGALRYEVEKEAMGWIGRPHAKAEANQAGAGDNVIIPYDELINQRMLDLERWNNMPHPEEPTLSRFEYFQQRQNPNLKPTNWNAILPVIGYKTTTSCQVGYISLQNRKRAIAENGQILTGELLIQKMRAIEGKELEIYWLDGNDGEVMKALVYMDGRLVCEAMEMPRYNRATAERTVADRDAQNLQSAYVATVEAFAKSQRQRIDNIQIIDKTPKTVSSTFRFSNLKRYEANEEPVEVFHPEPEEELAFIPTTNNTAGWRSNFKL
jgi:hypothetical protein